MSLHVQVASVVGGTSDSRWGQVLQTPHAYGVIEMYAPDGIARQRGITIFTKLTQMVSDPPVSLSSLELIADDVMTPDVVSLILFVPVGSVLYLVCRGEGQVYLKRGENLAVLLANSGALSGHIQPHDVVIAASRGFVDALSQQDVIGVFDHLSPQEVAEKLTILLHQKEGGEGGAAFIFQIHEGEGAIDMPPKREPVIHMRGRAAMHALRKAFRDKSRFMTPKYLVGTSIILFFLFSIYFGLRHQRLGTSNTKVSEAVAQATHLFDEGVALADLNPVKGRERLAQAKELLAPFVAKKSRSADFKKANDLYSKVTENLTQAMHIKAVKPSLFFDVALLKKSATVTDMALFQDTLGMLDSKGKTVYSLDVKTKKGQIAGGGEGFADVSRIATYQDKLYAFGSEGITAIRLNDLQAVPRVIARSDQWGSIQRILAYGGNLYLLDIGKNKIWKYVATENGFTDIREYFNADTLPDISQSTSMAIDGSVWLGSTLGSVLRFASGKESVYTPVGVEPPLGKHLIVYTADDAKYVYILDKNNNRVVVLDKDGVYVGQYIWDPPFAPTALAVSVNVKKLLFLWEGKIYDAALE